MHSIANLPPLGISKNNQVFFEKPIYFQKKTQISNVLRNLTISGAFYGKFATIWPKNYFRFSSVNVFADVAWTQLANIGKKTSEIAHLSGRFYLHILKNMAQNNKLLTMWGGGGGEYHRVIPFLINNSNE